jgi:hypothetical protein
MGIKASTLKEDHRFVGAVENICTKNGGSSRNVVECVK